ncbi:GNAT family N-acetyltransferase [Undibacterium sp. LX40W]|uniref:GNAT family N-acetyltransferase n=1 Tax=Undibacterium nitidum TaxID=2762298 RepID=A0A923HW18_9BURK|nr:MULTISPECIES: GNAT family N-acetyltransferase [Undibacterium]MBC3881171.1 GNAT family N-acetyltransferase [Undibacterium nitidum]MBC3890096.1 GNAT family N-acetyltransferase [Undibacterium sp. LX40W]
MLSIRAADLSDANRLSLLAETSFRHTFAASNTAEDMDTHCRNSYSEAIQSAEIAHPQMLTLLVEDDAQLAAYAQLRFDHAPECVADRNAAEIQRLYVANAWHGKGVAQSLMRACLDAIIERGKKTAWLGVWEHNPRAIKFYQKFGFVEVGEHAFPVGSDPQRDIILSLTLKR